MSAAIWPVPSANERAPGRLMKGRWDGGWLRRARRCPSPNFNERPAGTAVRLALIHSISLPPGQYGGDGVERLFTNRLDWDAHPYFQTIRGLEVSTHFLVRRDGELVQFVSCDARAWHAGASVWHDQPGCNDYSIGIELEGLEGETFDAPQYEVLVGLVSDLRTRYPIEGAVGHEHVAAGRKRDPGPGFDWARFGARLGWIEDPAGGGLMPRSAAL
jgi:N-acetyl-anhydromuramoyl-L-alanine amidase